MNTHGMHCGWFSTRFASFAVTVFGLATLAGCTTDGSAAVVVRGDLPGDRDSIVFAAPGRVEGASDVIEVGAGIDGIIKAVPVEAGQHVEAGVVLAILDCDELTAASSAARDEMEATTQSRARRLRGSRDEERNVAAAETAAAQAVLEQTRARHDRFERLAADDTPIVSRAEIDRARRDLRVAEESLKAAIENEHLVNAPPLREEIERHNALVRAARWRFKAASARVGKCVVTAPHSGTVLQLHLSPGEQVSLAFPRPIVSFADTTRLRIRAEVDERDIGRLELGQRARVTSDALDGETLAGHVVEIAAMMGRKKIRTGDPSEKSDRDVLEALIELDDDADSRRLVVGLRVTASFLGAGVTD